MPRSDIPAEHWGYEPEPKNWLAEAWQLSLFLSVTRGDDLEPMPEDGVTPEVA